MRCRIHSCSSFEVVRKKKWHTSIVDIPLGLSVTPRLPLVAFGCDMACVCGHLNAVFFTRAGLAQRAPLVGSAGGVAASDGFQSCLVKEKSRIPYRPPFAVLDHILSSSLSSAANEMGCVVYLGDVL